MRIVKLSQDEFATFEDARRFFEAEMPERTPPGRFEVTAGRVAADSFRAGERLLFTYAGRVRYLGQAASAILPNVGETASAYPSYFAVDLASLIPADADMTEVERRYQEASGRTINLARTQAWSRLEDERAADELWKWLGGE